MVIMSAIVTTVSVSLVIACFGYYTYGSNVKGDILVNYPGSALIITDLSFGVLILLYSSLQCRNLSDINCADLRCLPGCVFLSAASTPSEEVPTHALVHLDSRRIEQ